MTFRKPEREVRPWRGIFERGIGLVVQVGAPSLQRVDMITREFGEKASQLVESAAPADLDVKALRAMDRTSVATLVARLLRLADRGTSQGLALDDNIQ
ncbi:hypothetical protein MK139_15455, partial [bacterium]|nr:hypothetical protein [bacterium]